ncbi:hypothetical protein J2S68_001834 [Glycomyces algeriensis]|uniref:Uncharacterized protein n=1 Tax=Glycomyces algeriensis TaxID=256037 RepID=A0A9W6GA23_9ACTN|nr:hypothetical protein [Glycomyces algeriensis]MDA1364262.1 hypothetical protein [Glycomyces algeriensis]MDR7350291.1 hypothetical protein [Glycomyces algeriensis]GLI42999.1 hypothetical protein GALLR39Z86_28490 [Glycomyces algeriensis]
MTLVRGDLAVDNRETGVEVVDLGPHLRFVLSKQLEPFGLVASARSDEFDEPPDPGERHTGFAEPVAQPEPFDVLPLEDTPAARVSRNIAQEQAFPFEEPDRVHAQSGRLGDRADSELFYTLCHPEIIT